MPMMDYEEEAPRRVDEAYRRLAGSIEERGSPIMPGNAHLARQLLWIDMEWPEAVARARWFLGGPQYWAWRLSGVAAMEVTYLAAQTHLWNVRDRSFTLVVEERRWRRLLPDVAPAWTVLGRLKAEYARRYDLSSGIEILCGIHDSSANFYRYQQAGFRDLAVISTGTWIVGLSDAIDRQAFAPTDTVIRNADVRGDPLAGILVMGGREFAILARETGDEPVDAQSVAELVASDTMALPSFVKDDGAFPGSAGMGRIIGPMPATQEARRALALLYVALLTDASLDALGSAPTTVLDGSFVKDRLYATLVASLRPDERILFSNDAYGTAAGAALLADHAKRTRPAPVVVQSPGPARIAGLDQYRRRWRQLAQNTGSAANVSMERQI
jgi:sugar (pentulose or hexulose) kinase